MDKKRRTLLITVAAVLLVVAAFLLLRRSQPLGELLPAPETAHPAVAYKIDGNAQQVFSELCAVISEYGTYTR